MIVNVIGRSLLQVTRLVSVQRRFCQERSENMIRRTQIKKVLCVAEKNDAAKGIAEIMSNGRARRVSSIPVFFLLSVTLYRCRLLRVSIVFPCSHVISLFVFGQLQREGLSVYNKLYEYDYNLFGQVRLIFFK